MLSTRDKIEKLVRSKPAGWAFTAKDLARIAPRSTVDWALYDLVQDGQLERAVRGVYYRPKISKLLNEQLGPDVNQVAQALARKFGWTIQPSGGTALNYLGLSTQLPGRYLYQSSGPNRKYKVRNTTLEFETTPLKEAEFRLDESMLIVRALKALGEDGIDQDVIAKLRKWLNPELRSKVLDDTKTVTGWVYKAIRKICEEDG